MTNFEEESENPSRRSLGLVLALTFLLLR
jgi:hypothetical protein